MISLWRINNVLWCWYIGCGDIPCKILRNCRFTFPKLLDISLNSINSHSRDILSSHTIPPRIRYSNEIIAYLNGLDKTAPGSMPWWCINKTVFDGFSIWASISVYLPHANTQCQSRRIYHTCIPPLVIFKRFKFHDTAGLYASLLSFLLIGLILISYFYPHRGS